jgi:Iron-containing redox enzyme
MSTFTPIDSRGPISDALLTMLNTPVDQDPGLDPEFVLEVARTVRDTPNILIDDDLQLSLLILYSLHYDGLGDWDPYWEWQPKLLSIRLVLEEGFESTLRDRLPAPELPPAQVEDVANALFTLTADDGGPSVSKFIAREASVEQAREFLVHKSLYTLKEADPHSWAIPRLHGRAKAALVEIQADEYGGGRPERMHATIFAGTMRGVGLSDAYGFYINHLPALTLASFNMMSMFGLNRRLRGAITGHLAAFEMTSSIPNRFYGNGLRRLGFDRDVTWYFDEHVEADAVHEQIAGRDLAGSLAHDEPGLLPDIIFGAQACLYMDGLTGAHLLDTWKRGESSLRLPLSETMVRI